MKTAVSAIIFAVTFAVVLKNSWCRIDTYRLPKNVKPLHYNLTIQPNFTTDTFNGSVVIDFIALEDSDSITLHKKTIRIDNSSIRVLSFDEVETEVEKTTQDKENQTYTIYTKTPLTKDTKYHLVIGNYTGFLKQKLVGFYGSSYYDNEGTKRKFALTDFETIDARRAFPCFDEPALKAKFIINLIRSEDYISAANEELESTIYLGNNLYKDIYKETLEMSTYLVAFAVFDFDYINVTRNSKIYGRPEAIKNGDFLSASKFTERVLQAMENFTGIKYSLPKIDQIAIPDGGFSSSAMENWGLVTYREEVLAFSNTSATEEIQRNLGTVAHEISHQWFGNLVSPLWWDSLWLNEAFASYFSHYILDTLNPSWRIFEQFASHQLQRGFQSELSYKTTRILDNFTEKNGVFVIYYRGAIVVRMMEHFLTRAVFNSGLRRYLNRHQFGSAQTTDLYEALQTAVDESESKHLLGNLTVAEILNSWVNQTGFPIVTVTRNYTTGSVTFTQKTVQYDDDGIADIEDEEVLYHIPINYVFQSDKPEKILKTSADVWLSKKSMTIHNLNPNGWLLVNIQQTGFYRVNYDLENWERIIEFMRNGNFEAIPPVNRAQLIDDAFRLASSKDIPYKIAFKLSEYLVRERDYIPIKSFVNSKSVISEYFKNLFLQRKHKEINEFWNYTIGYTEPEEFVAEEVKHAYLFHILENAYNYVGISERKNDLHLVNVLRPLLIRSIYSRVCSCRQDLRAEFARLRVEGLASIQPNMQTLVFCEGAQTVSGKNFLLRLYQQTSDSFIKTRIKDALHCYNNMNYY